MNVLSVRTSRVGAGLALVLLAALSAASPGSAQLPDPTNLQVLPDTLTGRQMMPIMREIAGGLGVTCIHCHVGDNAADLSTFDFSLDDKETKRVARQMLVMVQNINSEHIARAVAQRDTPSDALEVTCATCHRGQTRPRFIEDIVAERLEADGMDAAVARYNELKEQYFGGYQYDFRPGPLNSLAETMSRQGRFDEAITFAQMAVDYDPENPGSLYTLAQTQERAGMLEDALETMTKALEVSEPNFRGFFEREIRRLRGGD